MDQNIELRPLAAQDESAFLNCLTLWPESEQQWITFDWQAGMSHSSHLERLDKNKKGLDLPNGWVASSMLYGFAGETMIGRLHIRHALTEFLLNCGGHIGFAVARPYRQKGYGKTMLKLALPYCRDLGLKRVLITCNTDNQGSKKIIQSCGGQFEDLRKSPTNNTLVERYWLTL